MTFTRVALAGSVIGSILVISQASNIRLIGFLLWLIANTVWAVDAYKRKDKNQLILWVFYDITALLGVVSNIGIYIL